MTNTERDQAIAEARWDMQQHAIRQDWPKAQAAQDLMRSLIAGRTPGRIAYMETEQGLR